MDTIGNSSFNNAPQEEIVVKGEKQFYREHLMDVSVTSTGYRGGNSGHGAYSDIQLENIGSTEWEITVVDSSGQEYKFDMAPRSLRIRAGGDAEQTSFAEAFEFIAKTMRTANGITEAKLPKVEAGLHTISA